LDDVAGNVWQAGPLTASTVLALPTAATPSAASALASERQHMSPCVCLS